MISVKVSHIEVVQSIQNAINDPYDGTTACMGPITTGGVPLVTGKSTFVRVYFDNFNPEDRIKAKGILAVEYTDSANLPQTTTVPSQGVGSRYEGASPTLIDQRLNWGLSLNFELPHEITIRPGVKKFILESLTDTITNQPIEIVDTPLPPNCDLEVEFLEAKKLTCRALIFRYRDVRNNVYLEPTREEVNTIRKFVERSFPVARVEWSVIRIQAQRDFFALDRATQYEREHDELATKMLAKMLHQIMAHRNQELKAGFSRKTYYIGVFSDPQGRFGSVAVDAPQFPLPHVVAACATDSTGENGAHEIGHLLGRSHPGVPLLEIHGREIGQYRIDKLALTHMGKEGHLSPPDKTGDEDMYIGLDINASNTSPTVLAPTKTFDLMSYRAPRWPSAYTYRELYKRLACTSDMNFQCNPKRHWTVICSFDINKKEGQILSVLPTNYRTPEKPDGYVTIEQYIVRQAFDRLKSQLDWLRDYDSENQKTWDLLRALIPEFALKSGSPVHDSAKSAPIAYTVSSYNDFILAFIDELGLPYEEIIPLLTSNNIATELYEPDIRIFPNYSADGEEPNCFEDDKQYMWDNGIDVYYRRIGSKDRFPFGLFQATVTSKPDSKEPPASITLMIDRIVVDKYAQSFEKKSNARKVAKVIFKLTDCIYAQKCDGVNMLPVGNGGDCEDRPPSNSLVYDIRKDGYFLNFHWSMAVLRQEPSNEKAATITTTIQCWRSSNCVDSDLVKDKWETVCVTDELRGQVWISPDLFKIEYDPGCPDERPSAKKPTRPVAARKNDELKFRISITVGFFEFLSDEYVASPVLVKPRRKDRFKCAKSVDQCPDDFQYDDGTPSVIDDYTPV